MKPSAICLVSVALVASYASTQELEPIPAPLPQAAPATPTLADPRFNTDPQPTPADPRGQESNDLRQQESSAAADLNYPPRPTVAPPQAVTTPSPSSANAYRWVPGRSSRRAVLQNSGPSPPIRYRVYERRDRWGRRQLVLVEQAPSAVAVAGFDEPRHRSPSAARVLATEPIVAYRRTPVRAIPATVQLPGTATVLAVPGPAYVPGQPIRNAIRARRF